MKTLWTEIKKTRRRKVWMLLPGALLLILGWSCWAMGKQDAEELKTGYYYLLLQLPMINTIILPPILAVLASRLCDIENKGNTYKLLCTLEKKGRIFADKLLLGTFYVVVLVGLELLLMLFSGTAFSVTQPVPWKQVGEWVIVTFLTSLVLLLLQQILSLMMDNQLYPLFIGIIGAFLGLFSWFFQSLSLRSLLPWSYYCVGTTVRYNWYEDTRIMEFYTVPFPLGRFAGLCVFGVLLYILGRRLFVNKEI